MKALGYLRGINNIRRIRKSFRKLNKASRRLYKEKSLRIYIENNQNVNIFNYLYYRIRWKKYCGGDTNE